MSKIITKFLRVKEKTTAAGIAGAIGSIISIPLEYMDPLEAFITLVISILTIIYEHDPKPTGGTIDPIPPKVP